MTPFGKTLLARLRALQKDADRAAGKHLAAIDAALKPAEGHGTAPRPASGARRVRKTV